MENHTSNKCPSCQILMVLKHWRNIRFKTRLVFNCQRTFWWTPTWIYM